MLAVKRPREVFVRRRKREALLKEQAQLEGKQKAWLEEKKKRSKRAKGAKALRNLSTASQQPPPVGFFDFYRISTLLTSLFQVQPPPTMAGDSWLKGPPRTVGPEPSRHGCMYETEEERRVRIEALKGLWGPSQLKALRQEANSQQRKLRKAAEDARKEVLDPQVRF